ncbi:MAG: hypothetical protein RSD40_02080 [Bacilli bacterium]
MDNKDLLRNNVKIRHLSAMKYRLNLTKESLEGVEDLKYLDYISDKF